jgi:Fe-S-cluster containining protein
MKQLKVLRLKTDCGACVNNCCSQPYDWVYLTSRESSRLKDASGVPEEEFMSPRADANTGEVFHTLNRPCRFLDTKTGRCTVYESRPLACRLFPFYVDPFTGHATLYPVGCGDNMIFPPADSEEGWRLIDREGDVRQWMAEFWDDVRSESTP